MDNPENLTRRRKKNRKHSATRVGHHDTQTITKNANKTWTLLQTRSKNMTILSVLAQTNNPSWSMSMLCHWITCSHVETRSTLMHYHDYKSTILCCSYSLLVIGETIDTNYKVFYFILTNECPTRTEHTSSWIIEAVRFLIVRKKNNNVRLILTKMYISL